MPRTSTNKKAEAEKAADDIAERVLSKMKAEDEDNFEPLNLETEKEYGDQLAEVIGFDIFDYGEDIQKKGDQIIYTIKKNGEMIGSRYHPCSWDIIQREYGPGSYQVLARSLSTKRFLKSETRPIAALSPEDIKFKFGREPEPPAPQNNQPNFIEMFTLMNNVSEKSKTEAREAAKEQAANSTSMMQIFSTMITSMSTQSQNMMMEMTKLQMSVAEKMTDTTNKLFEKMDSRFEKIVEKMSESNNKKKDEGMSPVEMIKFAEDSQKKGFDMFSKIVDLAEAKAQEKIDLMEENKGSSGKHEKTSTLDKILESVIPIVAKSVEAQQVQTQAMQHPHNRRMLPRSPQRPHSAQTAGLGQRTASPQAQTANARTHEQNPANSEQLGPDSRVNNQEAPAKINEFGLPTASFEPKPVMEAAPVTKDMIEEWLVPTIGAALLVLEQPAQGADRIKKVLQEKNITVQLFVDTFKKEDAKAIVAKFSLPQEAEAWFEEVYANIEASA